MTTLLVGFAIGAFAIIATRKDGPWGIIARVRQAIGTPLQCSVCAAFWCWLALSPLFVLPDGVSVTEVVSFGGALGVAFAVLALAGALDLDR